MPFDDYATDSQYLDIMGIKVVTAFANRVALVRTSIVSPVAAAVPPVMGERSVYQSPRGARPVAAAGAIAIVAGLVVAITMITVDVTPRLHRGINVITLRDLQLKPPPAHRSHAAPHPVAKPVFSPPRIVEIPSPVPPVVVSASPAPVPPTPIASPPAPGPSADAAKPAPGPSPSPTSVDQGDLSGRMIAAEPPTYPQDSRRLHEQGTVKLAVLVGVDGRVDEVSILATSGSYRLDRAALGAVRHWRWSPIIRDGVAVMVRGFVSIPFILRA